MSRPQAFTLRRVTDPQDPALAAFGRLQEAVYFEPEMLIPARYIAQMLGQQGGARQNFLLVAEEGGQLLGGTLFHYLPAARSAFSSFLGVGRAARGRGVARALHEERMRLLAQAAGHPVGVFIDVASPQRLSERERAREVAVGMDPRQRRAVFQALGFRTVDLPYAQPVGGEHGGPLTTLDLLYCPPLPAERVAVQLVADTMRAYWTPWLGAARAEREAAQLAEAAGGRAEVALLDAGQSPRQRPQGM